MDLRDHDRIAGRLQSLAFEPQFWPDMLQTLSDVAGAAGANLLSNTNRLPGLPCSPGMEPVLRAYFDEGWNTRDPRFRAMPKALKTGIASDQDCISPDAMRTSPYYARLGEFGLRWFAAITVSVNDEFWSVSFQRSIHRAPFSAEELSALSTLCRPLSEAAMLSRVFGMNRVLGLMEALESTRHPALVLDEAGQVLAMNTLVTPLLGVSIDVTRRTPRLFDPASQARFDQLLKRTLVTEPVSGPIDMTATLRTRTGTLTSLRMLRLRNWPHYSFSNAAVLVILARAAAVDPRTVATLGSSFGLTANEIRLAQALAEGRSLAEAAAAFGVSYETVRSHLKGLLRKTDTNRQAELVVLIRSLTDI